MIRKTEIPVGEKNKADFITIRNIDLQLLSAVSSHFNNVGGIRLVVSGSYAIEALTGYELKHNDIDTNVFTSNLSKSIKKVAFIMENLSVSGLNLHLLKTTCDRLEYNVLLDQRNFRRLELQFVEAKKIKGSKNSYRLKNGSVVPTVLVPIKNSKGQEYFFWVKSLPYTIATWAIRVSGLVKNPKRQVRQSDIEHLGLLLSGSFREEDVISAMSHHPQMPDNISVLEVYKRAKERLKT